LKIQHRYSQRRCLDANKRILVSYIIHLGYLRSQNNNSVLSNLWVTQD